MGYFRSFCALSLLACSVQAAIKSTGFTVSLTDIDYFLPPKPVARISDCHEVMSLFEDGVFVPFTVVKGNGSITSYAEDDVWQDGFLEALYVQGDSEMGNVSTTVISGEASSELAPGPYFINAACQVFEAWRLFLDVQGAFSESAIANGDGSYSVLPAGTVSQNLAIAVPSRLYFTKTAKKPLAGIRIGIKDIIDIKGLKTSNGNRAWYRFYPPASNTAPVVQKLIDAGAVIVGKTVTSQFANGEMATADWVDYHEPFNPRGDGYQDTTSSSSGSGASIASYDWLDVALGTDTGGSVRFPAQAQGIFGNRPSHGLVSLDNITPLSPVLDTVGLLARDPILWQEAAQVIYGSNITITDVYPKSIKTLGWPTSASGAASKVFIDFLSNLTDFLGAKTSDYDVAVAFNEGNPKLAPLPTILDVTYPILITKQQIELVREPFYADYAAKHDGRQPFVNPVPIARWGWGDNQTLTVDEAIANKTIFMTWANETFLAPSRETCSESLVIYIQSILGTVYRNVYSEGPYIPSGFGPGRIATFAEGPDFTVPIGEAGYESTITGHVEYLPLAVNILAAKGCDGMLFSLIGDLYRAGVLKKSLVGRSAVTGGEVLSRGG